jgi:23S rRNA (adenine-N6)-dimethyltransferase
MPPRTARDARRRALGQNFLVDERAIAAVVGTLDPPPGALVLDLGAGAGALTAAVAARGARVLAVERDPGWARALRERAAGWGDVAVVHGDALAVPFPRVPFLVVSSAPYGISTKLVRRLLQDAHGLERAVLVLQLQAARRLAGRPAGGRFAATWAPWFELRVRRRIPAAAFRPVPSVVSAILTLAPRDVPLLSPAAFPAYERMLGAVFGGRGRTVAERLGRALGRRRVAAALSRAGIERAALPSAVAPEHYSALFAALQPRPAQTVLVSR